MADLIKIDSHIHKRVKIIAATQGVTIKDFTEAIILKELEKLENSEKKVNIFDPFKE